MKKISIVMLQHNRADYTKRTLESLYINTDYKDFNIRIADCLSDYDQYIQTKEDKYYLDLDKKIYD